MMVAVVAAVLGVMERWGLGLILISGEGEEGGRCGIWLLYVSVVLLLWVSGGGGGLDGVGFWVGWRT